MTNWRKFWAGLTRNWENKVLLLVILGFGVFFFLLVQQFRFTPYDANQYLYNLLGGTVSGVITTLTLTFFFQRQEERRNVSQNRAELIHLSNAWLEQCKDLLEKMGVDIRPAPDLSTFEEKEGNVREKVESLIADLAGNRAELQKTLETLSYVKYKDYLHRLSTIGHLNKQYGETAGQELRQILSDLSIATEKVDAKFNSHTSPWVSGTENVGGQYRAVVVGSKSEAEQMADLVNQSLVDTQNAFKALERVKSKLDNLLLDV